MGGGGGGGGWNPFENVSWNKPFGDSAASSLAGGSGGLSSVFNTVSWDKPFGTDSTLGQALYGNQNAPLNADGTPKDPNLVSSPNPSAPPGASLGMPLVTPKPTPTTTSPAIPMAYSPGALPKYMNNASEMAFRNAYLNSFKPNTNFNINAEASPYKNISQGSIGNTSTITNNVRR